MYPSDTGLADVGNVQVTDSPRARWVGVSAGDDSRWGRYGPRRGYRRDARVVGGPEGGASDCFR